MDRAQKGKIIKDLEKKIALIVGPRQVGKTYLARNIGREFTNTIYLNYDSILDRPIIEQQKWIPTADLLILDELHKMEQWKNHLKGIFDTRPPNLRILVTGSARLDTVRQAGDSLAGRFFSHRLLPLSLKELRSQAWPGDLDRLLERGGFPEPFLADDPIEAQRWRRQYLDGLIRKDILDFKNIQDLRAMNLLVEMLRYRVGSPVSYASLARDLSISPTTVIKYVTVLESLFIVFKVTPYSKNIARSISKEPKLYFFDTGLVPQGHSGARLENLAAVALLKHVCALCDYLGEEWQLHYLRTKEGKEADFCIAKDKRVMTAVEIKNSDSHPASGLSYFCNKYSIKGIQLVRHLHNERVERNVEIRRLENYMLELEM